MADKKEKKVTDKDYFEEARSWDSSLVMEKEKSKRVAWIVAGASCAVTVCLACAIAAMMPLKTVQTSVVMVDKATGHVEYVTDIKKMNESEEQTMRRFWLSSYVRHREQWNYYTRDEDRQQVGLMSSTAVQRAYAAYTDSKNPQAPVNVYNQDDKVIVKINPAITYIDDGKTKTEDGDRIYTALVRYTTTIERTGTQPKTDYWASTVSFVYRKEPMRVDDRMINPVGFQVINYRKDLESGSN